MAQALLVNRHRFLSDARWRLLSLGKARHDLNTQPYSKFLSSMSSECKENEDGVRRKNLERNFRAPISVETGNI